VGLTPRSSDRLFLPAWIWPARIAYQSAVRAGAGEDFWWGVLDHGWKRRRMEDRI